MFFGAGRHFERAQAAGEAQIAMHSPNAANAGQRTTVIADMFDARFDNAGQLASVHGAPNARIVSQFPGQRDRVSTSDTVDAIFQPGGGIQSVEQQGHLAYADGERKASGDHARYTPGDQVLVLTGSPRVAEGGMTTTARSIRFNRSTGDALAEGDVKTTYSDLKPQAGGALLSASSPIHVTARSMTVHNGSHIAIYAGDARLWQDANVVQAQALEFDRDHRSMVAQGASPGGSTSIPVSTVLVQTDRSGKTTQVAMTSQHLNYADSDRQAHFEGDVVAKSGDVTITAQKIDAILQARGPGNRPQAVAGRLDKIIAQQQVVITQPGRRAEGELLIYTAVEDKFVLSGGSPSIFDAEHGKITGVSLTLFRRDGRVLVEGNNTSPSVTQTRVAR
jgi:lipopolysaccharide export system protein LptA